MSLRGALNMITAAVFGCLCPEAVAQEPPPDTVVYVLDEVRVDVMRIAAEGVPLARLPYAAQVLEVGRLPDPGAATAADLLTRLPGVTAADQFGTPFQPDLRMRGFQVSPVVGLPQGISVFVDGVRVNEPDASQVNFNLIPLTAVERVEVIRSPGGAFGRNTLGGAIHLVTRTGSDSPSGAVQVTGGSFGTRELEGWLGGSGPAGLHYLASGRLHRSEGWRDINRAEQVQTFTKLGWRGERSELSVSYTFADDYIEAPGSLPASWLRGELPPELAATKDPRRLQFTGSEGDSFDPTLHFAIANLRHELGSGSLQLNGFARSNRFVQSNDNITEPNVRGDTDIRSFGGAAQLAWSSGRDLSLSAGVEYVRNLVGIRIFEEPNPGFPGAGGMTEHVSSSDDNVGFFGHLRTPISGRGAATASIRYDWIHLPITDHLDPENSGENTFRQLTGSVGMDWLTAPGVRVFASYGRGFRAPVILEITCADPEDPCPLPFELGADPPLEPVKTDTWQAGARWVGGRAAELELVGYWAEVYDDLFNVVAVPSTRGYFRNLDRTRRRGLELSGSARAGLGLELSASLGLTRATFETEAELTSALLDDNEPAEGNEHEDAGEAARGVQVAPGNRFSMVPALSWTAEVASQPGSWGLSASASYVGSQYFVGDEGNEAEFGKLPAYLLVGAGLERSISALRVFLRIDNLMDSNHQTFGLLSANVRGPAEGAQPFLSPGLPRRATVGARFVF